MEQIEYENEMPVKYENPAYTADPTETVYETVKTKSPKHIKRPNKDGQPNKQNDVLKPELSKNKSEDGSDSKNPKPETKKPINETKRKPMLQASRYGIAIMALAALLILGAGIGVGVVIGKSVYEGHKNCEGSGLNTSQKGSSSSLIDATVRTHSFFRPAGFVSFHVEQIPSTVSTYTNISLTLSATYGSTEMKIESSYSTKSATYVTNLPFGSNCDYCIDRDLTSYTTLLLTPDDTTTQYIDQYQDGFYMLNSEQIGSHYFVISWSSIYRSSSYPPRLVLTASYNTCSVEFYSEQNNILAITGSNTTIEALETRIFRGNSVVRDFNGLEIKSNHKLSVFSTHERLYFYSTSSYGYAEPTEQLIPVNHFGNHFLIPQFNGQYGLYRANIRILAAHNDTNVVVISGTTNVQYTNKIINKGNTYDISYSTIPHSVNCSKLCSVAVMMQYIGSTSSHTAPAMTIIPGTNLFLTGNKVFATSRYTSSSYDMTLSIIAKNSCVGYMTIDGNPLQTTWVALPQTEYVYTNVASLTRTTHSIECKTSHFMAYIFGGYRSTTGVGVAYPISVNTSKE